MSVVNNNPPGSSSSMSPFLRVFREWVAVAVHQKIVFLHPDGRAWSFELDPAQIPLEKGRPRKYFDADSDSDEDQPKQQQQQQQQLQDKQDPQSGIVALEVHEGDSLLAVATGDKSLYLFEVILPSGDNDGTLNVQSRRLVSRSSSCMKFAPSAEFLVVCDKGGDCFKYDCRREERGKPGRWLFGHMSQVLDVEVDQAESVIVTCDRDEKIRVTAHPDCHNIETFCLGHTEFVSQLVHTGDRLYSLSGDRTLRTWDYRLGSEIARTELSRPGSKLALGKCDDGTVLVAVLGYEPTTVAVYKLADELKFEFVQDLAAGPERMFSAIAFTKDCSLVGVVLPTGDGEPTLAMFKYDGKVLQEGTNSMVDSFAEQFKGCKMPYVDTVSFLFKKKFDNITDYHERKRKRIEENNKTA